MYVYSVDWSVFGFGIVAHVCQDCGTFGVNIFIGPLQIAIGPRHPNGEQPQEG